MHADDYALSISGSKRIIELINAGKLDSISVIPNYGCFDEALELYKSTCERIENTRISVHLDFVEGRCLANPADMDMFVNSEGKFGIGWLQFVKYNSSGRRAKAKEQIKKEIKLQIEKVADAYGLSYDSLRIDSHQHTHMISFIMEALTEVIEENGWKVEFVRDMHEFWRPYLKHGSFYFSYSPVNMVKVVLLNHYSRKDAPMFARLGLSKMYASGVFLSGKMDLKRLRIILPELTKMAKEREACLEVLCHPGISTAEEMNREGNTTGFYVSENRNIEYMMVSEI